MKSWDPWKAVSRGPPRVLPLPSDQLDNRPEFLIAIWTGTQRPRQLLPDGNVKRPTMDDLVLSLAPYGNASVHEFSAHDDTCLIGAGCQGLGLVSRQNHHDNGATYSAIPYPAFTSFASHDVVSPSPQSPNAGDTFPEAITGKPQSRLQSPDLDDPDPTAPEMISVISRHEAPGQPPQNDELLDDYAPSEAESNASCDSQCSGSKGPCSAGTCDFVTACRDENCTRPAVEPDVAHSAFILQTMTSAKEASANLASFQERKLILFFMFR